MKKSLITLYIQESSGEAFCCLESVKNHPVLKSLMWPNAYFIIIEYSFIHKTQCKYLSNSICEEKSIKKHIQIRHPCSSYQGVPWRNTLVNRRLSAGGKGPQKICLCSDRSDSLRTWTTNCPSSPSSPNRPPADMEDVIRR